ncbi:hypothetical protein XA68_16561 [Ophiocordyceps unilateralis]|uniref:Uncharacterized protein n=1 Tax=Ophiocordyceps unilateralis TaxID=268505 RepID=A0A2A9P6B1_OPHUN|nr:hypothetical protein XA68_16561 [Ophiocordyceps unilateralis]
MDNEPLADSRPAAKLFDIYTDAPTVPRLPLVLPGGGCNFADLHSPLGLKCGCRRFYSRHPPEQAGWCMCNHHACYHDQGPEPDEHLLPSAAAGQENERPKTGREPLSPVGCAVDFADGCGPGTLSFLHDRSVKLDRRSVTEASLPDTLPWGGGWASPGPTPILPPIPSQCLLSSQASTTPSAQAMFLRPFGGKGLRTLHSGNQTPRSLSRHPGASPADDRPPNSPLSRQEPRTAGPVSLDALMDLTSAVNDHGQRLDRLETASFHADCHDRLDNADVRVYELESRVEEVEKMAGGAVTTHAVGPDDGAWSATSHPPHEVESQLQSLQEQVSLLQSYMPSPHCPLELDVVFLPFAVKRLWQELHQFKIQSATHGSDDWTQQTLSNPTRRSKSPFAGDWTCPDGETRWLLPKACSSTSVAARRLRSRGLIQTIHVSSPDYRSVQAAVDRAFGDVFREMGIAPRTSPPGLLGLHQSWVPLRKVHRDDRLRFLSPAEMVTPGLWDAQFLGSIMMRAARLVLFVTHPDAYVQDRRAFSTAWTWQRVREMSRVYPDESESQEVTEADALEECWVWSELLDEAPTSVTSSTARNAKPLLPRRHSVQPRQPLPFARDQNPRRDSTAPLLTRTGSAPHVVATGRQPSPLLASRRRVVSNGQSQRPSPSAGAGASQARVRKKRRRARSTSNQRHFAPRWTASPSPMQAYATPHSIAPPPAEMNLLRSETPTRRRRMSAMDLGDESGSGESYVGEEGDEEDSVDEDDGFGRLGGASRQWRLPEDEPGWVRAR